MIIKCDYCNKEFNKRPSLIKKHTNHFCSDKCNGLYKKQRTIDEIKNLFDIDFVINKETLMVTIKCDNCNKPVEVYPSRLLQTLKNDNNFFCGKDCRHEYDSVAFLGNANPNYKGRYYSICKQCGELYSVRMYRKNSTVYCSRDCKDNYLREHPEISIERLLAQEREFTKPERIVNDALIEHGYKFEAQYIVDDIYVADFFIPDLNLIIEVQGDYFHANPLFYGEGENKKPLTKRQVKRIKSDKKKLSYYRHKKFNVLYLWENDIIQKSFGDTIEQHILESVTTKWLCSNV